MAERKGDGVEKKKKKVIETERSKRERRYRMTHLQIVPEPMRSLENQTMFHSSDFQTCQDVRVICEDVGL